MFLHSGASLHGHEYSARRPAPQPQQKHMPMLRSALRPRPLSDTDARSFRQDPSLQTFSPEQLPLDDLAQPSPPPLRRRTATDSPLKRDLSVRFRDQIMGYYDQTPSTPVSEDEESIAGSELSDATETSTRRRRQKRAPRQSTRFALAHPAPQLRTKQRRLVQIRPRLLLQLQQLGDKRAVPAYDVVPSSLVAGSIIIPRLAKRFPKVFRAKPELGQDDVLIVRSEDYDSPNSESSRKARGDDDGLDHRDVLGVISTLPAGGDKCVEIVMEDGSTWAASLMSTGSYEFTGVDSQGHAKTARWIKKSITPSRRNSAPVGALPAAPEYKWTFSIIDPSTKRHPIMGAIRSNTLEIFDNYNTMSASSGRFPPTRAFGSEAVGTRSPRASVQEERATVTVSEEHRKLMLATGLFVGLRQNGWPASTSPKMGRVGAHCRSVSSGVPERSRGGSAKSLSPASSRPSSPRAADTPATSPEVGGAVPAPGPPRRAMSTGAAYMKKRQMAMGADKDVPVTQPAPVRRQHKDDGKTPTCGINVRHLAQKLFHRKSWQRHQKEMLKYKLDE